MQSSNYYDTHEFNEFNQKINNKFIRPSMHNKPQRYNIPASSELIASRRPFILQTISPKPMQIPTYRPPTAAAPAARAAIPMSAAVPAVPSSPVEMNCILVNDHATTCLVCSKLYKTYHAIYLSVIAILVIIILFLLKKFFMTKPFKGT